MGLMPTIIGCMVLLMCPLLVQGQATNKVVQTILQLSAGTRTSGRIEMQFGGQWFPLCTSQLTPDTGKLICNQLGLGGFGKAASFGQLTDATGKNYAAISKFTCSSSVTQVSDCTHSLPDTTCPHAGVVCAAVDCVVADGVWGSCSATCGGGQQTQTRTITVNPTPGGLPCPDIVLTRPCNTPSCPVDCLMSSWSNWTDCSLACGGGTQSRFRTVVTSPSPDGQPCPNDITKTQACNQVECGRACVTSDWGAWSDCTKLCGSGSKSHSRTIIVSPTGNGTPCGNLTESWPCNTQSCPIDCIISPWGDWGLCSKACGNGTQLRTRYVTNQPAYGGTPCPELAQYGPCNTDPCAVDCEMTQWTSWGGCTADCGTGSTTRSRHIVSDAQNGGLPCGDETDSIPCNTQKCPQDRAEILVDRIRKLELQDRINTLEELQAQQASQLAQTQTEDLLSQIGVDSVLGGGGGSTAGGGGAAATGGAGTTAPASLLFLEEGEEAVGVAPKHSTLPLASPSPSPSAYHPTPLTSSLFFSSSPSPSFLDVLSVLQQAHEEVRTIPGQQHLTFSQFVSESHQGKHFQPSLAALLHTELVQARAEEAQQQPQREQSASQPLLPPRFAVREGVGGGERRRKPSVGGGGVALNPPAPVAAPAAAAEQFTEDEDEVDEVVDAQGHHHRHHRRHHRRNNAANSEEEAFSAQQQQQQSLFAHATPIVQQQQPQQQTALPRFAKKKA